MISPRFLSSAATNLFPKFRSRKIVYELSGGLEVKLASDRGLYLSREAIKIFGE